MNAAASRSKDARTLDIYHGDPLDEAQFAAWVKQASLLSNGCERPALPLDCRGFR
jgi:hypothetical protein